MADVNSLVNMHNECRDLVRVKNERIANYKQQTAAQDSINDKQGELLDIAEENVTDAVAEIKRQKKKKRGWMVATVTTAAVLVAENWVLFVRR